LHSTFPRKINMNTETNATDPDLRDEYDFSKGVRGKYAQRMKQGSNVVVLAPDMAALFPDSDSVNAALRALADVAQRSVKQKAG